MWTGVHEKQATLSKVKWSPTTESKEHVLNHPVGFFFSQRFFNLPPASGKRHFFGGSYFSSGVETAYTLVNWHSNGKWTLWRWFSYWTWRYSSDRYVSLPEVDENHPPENGSWIAMLWGMYGHQNVKRLFASLGPKVLGLVPAQWHEAVKKLPFKAGLERSTQFLCKIPGIVYWQKWVKTCQTCAMNCHEKGHCFLPQVFFFFRVAIFFGLLNFCLRGMVTSILILGDDIPSSWFGKWLLACLAQHGLLLFGLCQANTSSIHAKAADKIIEVGRVTLSKDGKLL